jgi:hypothetical protein
MKPSSASHRRDHAPASSTTTGAATAKKLAMRGPTPASTLRTRRRYAVASVSRFAAAAGG